MKSNRIELGNIQQYMCKTKHEAFDNRIEHLRISILTDLSNDKRPGEFRLLPTIIEKYFNYRDEPDIETCLKNLRGMKKKGAVQCTSYYMILGIIESFGHKVKYTSEECKIRVQWSREKLASLRKGFQFAVLFRILNMKVSTFLNSKAAVLDRKLIDSLFSKQFDSEYDKYFKTPTRPLVIEKKTQPGGFKNEAGLVCNADIFKTPQTTPKPAPSVLDKTALNKICQIEGEVIELAIKLHNADKKNTKKKLEEKMKELYLNWSLTSNSLFKGVPRRSSIRIKASKLCSEDLSRVYTVLERFGFGAVVQTDGGVDFKVRPAS